MRPDLKRRKFIKTAGVFGGALYLAPQAVVKACGEAAHKKFRFDISLAQWSLHRALRKGEMDNLAFAQIAKIKFGISAVEYVNTFFKDKAQDIRYLNQMKSVSRDHDVRNILIMIDREGNLGDDTDKAKRSQAVRNHYKWVEAARQLECHSIRVNAKGTGTGEEVKKAAIDSLSELSAFAKDYEINVIVENHGGYSSNGQWLSEVISGVNMKNCGTLPDFGNFCLERGENRKCLAEYDRYQGVKELMHYAKGVSAKSHDFNEHGDETRTDYRKMLRIVKQAGYSGHIGIEYEGRELSEPEGIRATKKLLEKVREELS